VAPVFGVDVSHRGEQVLLHVRGELDLATAPVFRQVAAGPATVGASQVVVDLTACDHLDSVGVGLLLGVLKRTRGRGGSVVVVCDEPRLLRVLELTGLDTLIPVVARIDEAVGMAAAVESEG
jgi:anti-sigma B factor antagonist